MPPLAPMTAAERFHRVLESDPRYDPEAYNFLYEALDYTIKNVVSNKNRTSQHVTGQELLEGIRRFAIEQFGCLARAVLETWGIRRTDDFGDMVFNLVAQDLMGKQDSDSKVDFQRVYDFEDVFDVKPVLSYASERREWKASYIARRQKVEKAEKVEGGRRN
jgi:uncharacterized repeat protein (TIGR04138 family)